MFINLTNANPEFRGNPVAIRKDLIVSVFGNSMTREDGSVDDVTLIFVPPHGSWEVQESYAEIVEKLNSNA
jgi:hypothetical protein